MAQSCPFLWAWADPWLHPQASLSIVIVKAASQIDLWGGRCITNFVVQDRLADRPRIWFVLIRGVRNLSLLRFVRSANSCSVSLEADDSFNLS